MSAQDKNLEEGATFAPQFSGDGLIPCVTIDHRTGDVLMVAHMNREALDKTLGSGIVARPGDQRAHRRFGVLAGRLGAQLGRTQNGGFDKVIHWIAFQQVVAISGPFTPSAAPSSLQLRRPI